MGYYVRAFCTADTVPTLNELETQLKLTYPNIRFETEDPRDGAWNSFLLIYDESHKPVVVDCNPKEGPDSLGYEETQEFIEELGKPGKDPAKIKVLDHLKATKYIICCQLLSDIDEDGCQTYYDFLQIFIKERGGLLQADGDGFYEGEEVIVEM